MSDIKNISDRERALRAELGHTKTLLGSSEMQVFDLRAKVLVRDATLAKLRVQEPVATVVAMSRGCTPSNEISKQLDAGTKLYLAAGAVPEGYQIVPIEPTKAMIEAGRRAPCDVSTQEDVDGDYIAVYKAMLAVAVKEPK